MERSPFVVSKGASPQVLPDRTSYNVTSRHTSGAAGRWAVCSLKITGDGLARSLGSERRAYNLLPRREGSIPPEQQARPC